MSRNVVVSFAGAIVDDSITLPSIKLHKTVFELYMMISAFIVILNENR